MGETNSKKAGITEEHVNNKFAKICKNIHFLFKLKNPIFSQFHILIKASQSIANVAKGIMDRELKNIEFIQLGIFSHQV